MNNAFFLESWLLFFVIICVLVLCCTNPLNAAKWEILVYTDSFVLDAPKITAYINADLKAKNRATGKNQ